MSAPVDSQSPDDISGHDRAPSLVPGLPGGARLCRCVPSRFAARTCRSRSVRGRNPPRSCLRPGGSRPERRPITWRSSGRSSATGGQRGSGRGPRAGGARRHRHGDRSIRGWDGATGGRSPSPPTRGRLDPVFSSRRVCDRRPRPEAFCAGLFRPRVYVTSGAVELLDDAGLDAVLAHERQHAQGVTRCALQRVV